jgi:hypothetical protein
MNRPIIQFGEQLSGYQVPVLNERAVRASAGILFFFAFIAFMNAFLMGNFQPTRVFVVAFLVDFAIRIFINPYYAPSLIIGQWVVRKQQAEYVGAPQKRFAWAIGFVLALAMLYLMVLNNVIGPINMLVCSTCLLLMFFESAFGICLGCKVYNRFNKEKAQLCPGGACEVPVAQHRGMTRAQVLVLLAFVGLLLVLFQWVYSTGLSSRPAASPATLGTPAPSAVDAAELERCRVPEFAKALGHEEKWKLHNNCK